MGQYQRSRWRYGRLATHLAAAEAELGSRGCSPPLGGARGAHPGTLQGDGPRGREWQEAPSQTMVRKVSAQFSRPTIAAMYHTWDWWAWMILYLCPARHTAYS